MPWYVYVVTGLLTPSTEAFQYVGREVTEVDLQEEGDNVQALEEALREEEEEEEGEEEEEDEEEEDPARENQVTYLPGDLD